MADPPVMTYGGNQDMYVNWYQVISNIEEALEKISSSRSVGKLCDMPNHRIIKIQSGLSEPFWSEGMKLLDAHLDLCPKMHNQLIMMAGRDE